MKKILAFGASNSSASINKQLATYAANLIDQAEVHVLDLNDYEMPIFSIDREKESGIPQLANDFLAKLKMADGIVVSFAEHNGTYSVAFKNIFDWVSRLDGNLWSEVPMFAMATSPGGRGGQTVLETALARFKFMGGNIVAHFSLPSFYDNFETAAGIKNEELNIEFNRHLNHFIKAIHE